MEQPTDEERLISRVKAIRDNILCQHIGGVYQSLSPEELDTLWEHRWDLGMDANEIRILRDLVRAAKGFQPPPLAPYIHHVAADDWWSRSVDK